MGQQGSAHPAGWSQFQGRGTSPSSSLSPFPFSQCIAPATASSHGGSSSERSALGTAGAAGCLCGDVLSSQGSPVQPWLPWTSLVMQTHSQNSLDFKSIPFWPCLVLLTFHFFLLLSALRHQVSLYQWSQKRNTVHLDRSVGDVKSWRPLCSSWKQLPCDWSVLNAGIQRFSAPHRSGILTTGLLGSVSQRCYEMDVQEGDRQVKSTGLE